MSKEIIIAFIQAGRAELERTAKAVQEDKLNWKPLDNGRAALELLGDAAQAPAMGIGLLNGTLQYGPELFARLREERAHWSREEALAQLQTNTQALVEAIQSMTEEQLNATLTLPFGSGSTMPLGAWILMTYRSFMSRTAQINYIQTLYGDFEPH